MDVVVNPPKPGEPSYDLFAKVGVLKCLWIISPLYDL